MGFCSELGSSAESRSNGPYAIIAVPVQILYTVVMFFGLILWLPSVSSPRDCSGLLPLP